MRKIIKNIALEILPTDWMYDPERLRRKSSLQKERTLENELDAGGPEFEYTLKPFDRKEAILIHIPKCAGVSVSISLFGNLAGAHKIAENYRLTFCKEF